MCLLKREGNKFHLFFCKMFLATENTLSEGAVEAGMAALPRVEKAFHALSTTRVGHLF